MMVWCYSLQKNWTTITANRQMEVTKRILVYPDELKFNGNFMTGMVTDVQTGQREAVIMSFKSPQMLKKIDKLTTPSIWLINGQLKPLIPHTNENQFDNLTYNHHRRICNQVQITQIEQVNEQKQGIIGWCHTLRKRLSLYFETLPYPLSTYCHQLIIGSSNEDSAGLMVSVKRLGLLHLFCISGMHIVLFTDLFRRLLAHLWWRKESIDIFLIIILPFYLLVGGGATSLVRAVIMAELGLLHRYLNLDRLDGWALSLLIGLVLDPLLLLTLGGQLSYLLSFVLQVLPESVRGFKQSLLLNLISLPSLLSYVYEVHLLSFGVSYLIIPLFSTVIFPAVLVGALSFSFFEPLAYLINAGLRCFQYILNWLADFPGMIHFGKPPLILALLLFFASLFVISQDASLKSWKILALLYVITGGIIHFPLNGEVTFIDIGQGDSILIREPFNHRVTMIDTGGKLSFKKPNWATARHSQDDAQRITINYLKSKGISQIDTICLTHHDADHIGYLTTILENIAVKRVIVPAGMEKQPALLNKVRNVTNTTPIIIPVTDSVKLSSFPLQILHPFFPGEGKNEDSLVLTGKFGGKKFLFTGDLDQQNEEKVIQKYPQLKIDILKAGHHGSKTASSYSFLQTITPKYAIISAGRFNRYHHPDEITIKNFQKLNINYLSTQQFGMIQYVYYGHNGKIKTTLRGDETSWTLPNYLHN
ncbi:DNA internalization-related competence protein ComEC/Rec2 [Limosilactobacillus agrestis]|nr:DNA internalization-related competence protein ComEC/Rec2 [Limosilactobacillus agrestis]